MEFLKGPFWVLYFFIVCKWYEISCNWLWQIRLYPDDTCLLFRIENVCSIKKHLYVDFNGPCESLIDNKPSIHLGEDKAKCILFKKGKKQYSTLKFTRNENKIKEYSVVEYLRMYSRWKHLWRIHDKKGIKNINAKKQNKKTLCTE